MVMKSRFRELCGDMKALFNVMLPKRLLYEQERQQYYDFINEDGDGGSSSSENEGEDNNGKDLTQFYGPEHLLRFVVKLPSLLNSSPKTDNIEMLLKELAMFLHENRTFFFTNSYRIYVAKA
eukprot:TRINITY_DN514_c0_g2_i3.p1 TRINITY_DN514_c0_g2~~TRINITY_DN514_c0_g2_i3.p1  ORF type:complete len:122 (-),score=36.69 TRINITY_DN514_c0_g2_i3:59-424(-)